jgi:hypothetical protein
MSDKKNQEVVRQVEVENIVPLTINDLRGVLSEQIRLLRTNKTTPSAANAVTNAAGKIFASVKLEIELCKLLGVPPKMKIFEIEEKTSSN